MQICPACYQIMNIEDKVCVECKTQLYKEDIREYKEQMLPGTPSSEHIDVYYNVNQFSVVGSSFDISFFIQALDEHLRDFFLIVQDKSHQGKDYRIRDKKRLKLFARRTFSIPLSPEQSGATIYTIVICFRKGNEVFKYESKFKHKIFEKEHDQLAQSLQIHVNETIRQGFAENVSIGDTSNAKVDGIIEKFKSGGKLNKLIEDIHKVPPQWCRLHLEDSEESVYQQYLKSWKPNVLIPVKIKLPKTEPLKSLTLKTQDFRVHLTTESEIPFGRSKQGNLIVTRNFDPEGVATMDINCSISRRHGAIRVNGDGITVMDGSYRDNCYCPSALGTYIEKQKVDNSNPIKINTLNPCELQLADLKSRKGITLDQLIRFQIVSWTCPDKYHTACRNHCNSNRPAALLMKRRDHIPEIYIVLLGCLELGVIHDSLRGLLVWQKNSHLCYRTDKTNGLLKDKTTVELPYGKVGVAKWSQYCLSKDPDDKPDFARTVQWANPEEWEEWLKKTFE
jgi:hypothetical protein